MRKHSCRALCGAFLLLFLVTACGNTAAPAAVTTPDWEPIPETTADGSEGEAGAGEQPALSDSAALEETGAADVAQTAATEEAEEVSSSEDSGEAASADAPVQTRVLPESISAGEELTSLLVDFLSENGLNASNFSCAYKNLVTGETAYFNELTQMDAASTYKLPLNLLYYDKEAAGELTEDSIIQGTQTPLSECHRQSLEFSNNELSEAMMDALGSYDQVKQEMRRYMTLSDAETDDSYYHHNYFCARQIMDVAAYLYSHAGQYPDALQYLEAAQPGMYFKRYLTDVTIAQKYGRRDGWENCAGIIFGDTPFVLGIYSHNTSGGEDTVAKCAQLFYDYTE